MTRTRTRLALVCIALLAVASLPTLAPIQSPGDGTASAAEHTFVLEQGDRCHEVSPLRGDEDVVSFYDYRYPGNHDGTGRYTYSSFMPDHLTREDGSRLFLYEGPDGVSLVMVHNARSGTRDDGTAATFRFSGLPSDGHWAVRDDYYDGRDDRYSHNRIDWSWYGDRTDGAAFLGLDRAGTEITVDPAFDEEAELYDDPVDRSGQTETWQFLTGSLGSPETVELDRSSPVTIRTGHCGADERPPSAALSAEDGVAGYSVAFDASGSDDERGIETYRWDFDGDGEPERETDEPTVSHTYDSPGTYNATVTVVDEGDNTDQAGSQVEIDSDDPPSATFAVSSGSDSGGGDDGPVAGFPVTFDASNSTDDVGIATYWWDFDGDGEPERENDEPTVSRTFEEAGSYEVSLTVADGAGQNATATRTVSVAEDNPPDPAIRVIEPETPVEGDQVVFSAANSTDDTGIAEYRWRLGPDASATGERAAVTFDENGTYEVTLTAVDEGGNDASVTREVEVLGPDVTPPDAAAEVVPATVQAVDPAVVEAGVSVGFTANDSDDDRSVASYRWEFGDGATATGPTGSHAYDEPGDYTATVVVADGAGNTDRANVTVEVRPANPPNVSAAVPDVVVADEQFPVEGSASDESGVASYRWDFGDGATADGQTANHTYAAAGNYTVTLTAVDAGGHENAATAEVEVLPPDETPPTAALSVDDNRTDEGDPVRFDASNATDGESGVVEYRWDFDGDGAVDRRTDNATTTKSYGSAGTYDAAVIVADRANNTDGANVTVTVEQDERALGGGSGGGGSSGGGGGAVGPPPVVTEVEQPGPDRSAVDVRNARADEQVRADLPATAASEGTGVRFRELSVALASDDPHFVVEAARGEASSIATDSLPADATLGALSVDAKYLDAGTVEGVTYEVAVERSRLADAGLAPADSLTSARANESAGSLAAANLGAYERVGGAWERANVSVVERGETVVLRVRADGLVPVAVGADLPASVADASLAEREVAADDPVAANATVRNPGGDAETVALSLTADGEVVASETVEVAGNASERVTLDATLPPGEYDLALAGGDFDDATDLDTVTDLGTATVVERSADVGVASVSVNESTVAAGEQVAITAAVENAGTAPGEYTVNLTMFGERVASETVSVPPGETTRVTFVRAVDAAGNYTPAVGDESASLEVREPQEAQQTTGDGQSGPNIPVPGFGVGTAVAALVAAALISGLRVARRRE